VQNSFRANAWDPQAQYGFHVNEPSMRGEDATRYQMSFACREGQEALPYAWGAKGSGAPKGNCNALKHGTYTREALTRRAHLRALLQEARKLLREIE
jgi:hypothetical protein